MSSSTNLFLFRNLITSKVLVSNEFALKDSLLKQIREHRPGNSIRQDRWTPFAVLTGFQSPATVSHLQSLLAPLSGPPGPKERLPKPAPRQLTRLPKIQAKEGDKTVFVDAYPKHGYWTQYQPWQVPETIKEKVESLCEILRTDEVVEKDLKERSESMQPLYILWEREDYWKGLEGEWPAHVINLELAMKRGLPVIPGFNPAADLLMARKAKLEGEPKKRHLRYCH